MLENQVKAEEIVFLIPCLLVVPCCLIPRPSPCAGNGCFFGNVRMFGTSNFILSLPPKVIPSLGSPHRNAPLKGWDMDHPLSRTAIHPPKVVHAPMSTRLSPDLPASQCLATPPVRLSGHQNDWSDWVLG